MERRGDRESHSVCSLISDISPDDFCCILFFRVKSLGLAHSQTEEITHRGKYQEVEITEPSQKSACHSLQARYVFEVLCFIFKMYAYLHLC